MNYKNYLLTVSFALTALFTTNVLASEDYTVFFANKDRVKQRALVSVFVDKLKKSPEKELVIEMSNGVLTYRAKEFKSLVHKQGIENERVRIIAMTHPRPVGDPRGLWLSLITPDEKRFTDCDYSLNDYHYDNFNSMGCALNHLREKSMVNTPPKR